LDYEEPDCSVPSTCFGVDKSAEEKKSDAARRNKSSNNDKQATKSCWSMFVEKTPMRNKYASLVCR